MKTETKTEPLVKEVVINASSAKIWDAITDASRSKEWFMEQKGFKPEVGNEFTMLAVMNGKDFLHLCKVTEVIPEKKLSYTWKYKGITGDSHVTFELIPEGDKTRVKLTHEGLETFPQDNPDYARKNFDAGWTQILQKNLKALVEKS